jgi:hypothetical protein
VSEGRVCVRDPRACTLEARVEGGEWRPVGSSFDAATAVELRATGSRIELLVDGELVAMPRSGEAVSREVPADRCSIVSARIDGGASGPIYVNCPFAERRIAAR